MKLEIVEEKNYSDGVWYVVRVDDSSVCHSRKLEEAERVYQEFVCKK